MSIRYAKEFGFYPEGSGEEFFVWLQKLHNFIKGSLENTEKYKEEILFFFFFAVPQSMQDLSSPTRDQTRAPCSGSSES